MGTPHSARSTRTPSRVICMPSTGCATVTVRRASVGASASAWRCAVATYSVRPAALAALAASRYAAQAVAERPSFS